MQKIHVIQEIVEADPKVFPHKTVPSFSMGLPLRVVEAGVVLEDVEESEKGIRLGLGTMLAMEYFATKGNQPLHHGLLLCIPRPRGQGLNGYITLAIFGSPKHRGLKVDT